MVSGTSRVELVEMAGSCTTALRTILLSMMSEARRTKKPMVFLIEELQNLGKMEDGSAAKPVRTYGYCFKSKIFDS